MTKQLAISLFFTTTLFSWGFAQEKSEPLKWLEISMFHPKVFTRIFFDYDTATYPYHGIPPAGKCAFILPDSVFRIVFPKIFDRIDWSWPKEKMIATTTLVRNQKGTLFASANAMDVQIETWVRFDELEESNNQVNMIFHTTDYSGKSATDAFKYYRVSAVIKKTGSEWRVKKMKIKKIGCCDDRKDFVKGFRRDY